MMVSKEKSESLEERMRKLHINEDDLIEKFVLGSGPGGQKINKSATCVYIKHIPTGIEVKCQESRSREENRFIARRHLIEKLEKQILHEKTQKEKEEEKIRRQKRRRTRRRQEKILKEKKEHSEIKAQRQGIKYEE
jgi:peptide chain release factor